ncbi:MAG: hypothetical protein HZB14_00555 [Actinobacteria bacterium]|nr:hypothetical protein [Actinomycetota bacterium]
MRFARCLLAIAALAICQLAIASTAAGYTPGTVKNYKTAVLAVKYQDETPTVTLEDIRQRVFTGSDSAHEFLIASSQGRVGLEGDVFGWFTVPENTPPDCGASLDFLDISAAAESQAPFAPHNLNLHEYERIVFAAPGCGGALNLASGTSEGGGRRAWIVGDYVGTTTSVYTHEIVHTLRAGGRGIGHAGATTCRDGNFPVAYSTSCLDWDGADQNDLMGSGYRLQSTFMRVALGFLNYSDSTTANGSNTFEIYSTDQPPAPGRIYNLRVKLREPRISELGSPFPNAATGGGQAFLNIDYPVIDGQFGGGFSWIGQAPLRLAREIGHATNNGSGNGERARTLRVDTDPHTRWQLAQEQSAGLAPTSDYFYTPAPNPSVPDQSFEPLSMDTGFYDPDSNVLLRVISADTSKITVAYSEGLTPSERTSLEVVGKTLKVTAQAGYANDLHIRADAKGNIVVREGNAAVHNVAGCSTHKNIGYCPASRISQLIVDTGDRRDYVDVSLSGVAVNVRGGDGNDVLVGGSAVESMLGENGDDQIVSRGGNDNIVGGAGADRIESGDGADVITGLDGTDPDTVWCGAGTDKFEIGTGDILGTNPAHGCESNTGAETRILSGPQPTGSSTPTFEFVANKSTSTTFQCNLSASGGTWFGCTSPYTVSPPYASGNRAFRVRSIVSGVTDSSPASSSFAVSSADTNPPDLSISSPGAFATGTQSTLTYSIADASGLSGTPQCRINGGTAFSCNSGYQLSTPADGSYEISVTATDTVGNSVTVRRDFVVDNVTPAITIAGPNNTTIHSSRFDVEFDANDTNGIAETDCAVDGGTYEPCSAGWTSPAALGNGQHSVSIRAKDRAGTVATAVATFTIDTGGVQTSFSSGPADGSTITTSYTTFGVLGNSPYDSQRLEYRLDSNNWREITGSPTFTATLNLYGLAAGSHTIEVRAIDASETADPTPATRTFNVQ